MSRVAELALTVLGLAVTALARWLAHVHTRVDDLRERVARLEQRNQDRNGH